MGSPLQELQNLLYQQDPNTEFLDLILLRLGMNQQNYGLCSDLRVMIENLIILVDSKMQEVDSYTLNDIYDITEKVKDLSNNAVGCKILCKFCNRKCEHKPHNDNKVGGTKHSCDKRGH